MQFGLMIIGDEILNGSRTDAHFNAVREMLKARGLRLAWVEYIADEPVEIVARLQRSMAGDVPVFVTGGIGATPDDHTRQAAATALNRPIELHPDAAQFIVELSRTRGDALDSAVHLQRLNMAMFPKNADIVPNPINTVAGFSVDEHYFFPGFPVMAHPMMEWVLETYYQNAFFKERIEQRHAIIEGLQESQIAPLMIAIEHEFEGVKTYSLPNATKGRNVELGVKAQGDACDLLDAAWGQLFVNVIALGGVEAKDNSN